LLYAAHRSSRTSLQCRAEMSSRTPAAASGPPLSTAHTWQAHKDDSNKYGRNRKPQRWLQSQPPPLLRRPPTPESDCPSKPNTPCSGFFSFQPKHYPVQDRHLRRTWRRDEDALPVSQYARSFVISSNKAVARYPVSFRVFFRVTNSAASTSLSRSRLYLTPLILWMSMKTVHAQKQIRHSCSVACGEGRSNRNK
jgi:hypothetical protein